MAQHVQRDHAGGDGQRMVKRGEHHPHAQGRRALAHGGPALRLPRCYETTPGGSDAQKTRRSPSPSLSRGTSSVEATCMGVQMNPMVT